MRIDQSVCVHVRMHASTTAIVCTTIDDPHMYMYYMHIRVQYTHVLYMCISLLLHMDFHNQKPAQDII